MTRMKTFRIGLPVLVLALSAHGSVITYQTAPGATESGGNPVSANAVFTTGAGTLDITLTDLLADPKTVAQLVSDLDFVLSNGATIGTLGSSSGQEITVNADGTFTLGGTVATGWALNNNVGGAFS
jgi:outer membrane protease